MALRAIKRLDKDSSTEKIQKVRITYLQFLRYALRSPSFINSSTSSIYVCMYVCMLVYVCMYVCMHMDVCMYVCM